MNRRTRKALYLAISALAFAANDANAGCKLLSGRYVCASWITGSEICQVTVDINGPNTNGSVNEPDNVQVTCAITGGLFFPGGGEEIDTACLTGQLPTGDLTCGPPPPLTPNPTSPGAPSAGNSNGWVIFGVNGVDMNGGSSGNGPVGSNVKIALSGKSKIYGDAFADTFATNGGSSIIGATVSPENLALDPVAPCSPYSPDAGDLSGNASYNSTTGVLDLKGNGKAVLGGGPYCFSKILMSANSTLDLSFDTATINLTGPINNSGGQILTGGGSLTINSSSTTKFQFTGGFGENIALYAPSADLYFTGGTYFGSYIGKSVNLSGNSAINSTEPVVINGLNPDDTLTSDTVLANCNINGICTATAEVTPQTGGNAGTCENGGTAIDFTADSFVGHVTACDGGEGCEELWQFCTLNGNSYDCVDVPTPYYCD